MREISDFSRKDWSASVAARTAMELHGQFELLSQNPLMAASEKRVLQGNPRLQVWNYSTFNILFDAERILGVFHTARDPEAISEAVKRASAKLNV